MLNSSAPLTQSLTVAIGALVGVLMFALTFVVISRRNARHRPVLQGTATDVACRVEQLAGFVSREPARDSIVRAFESRPVSSITPDETGPASAVTILPSVASGDVLQPSP
jgi:hypothetical protein